MRQTRPFRSMIRQQGFNLCEYNNVNATYLPVVRYVTLVSHWHLQTFLKWSASARSACLPSIMTAFTFQSAMASALQAINARTTTNHTTLAILLQQRVYWSNKSNKLFKYSPAAVLSKHETFYLDRMHTNPKTSPFYACEKYN